MELLALSEQQEIQRLSEIYKLLMVVLEEQQDQREMLQTAQPVLLEILVSKARLALLAQMELVVLVDQPVQQVQLELKAQLELLAQMEPAELEAQLVQLAQLALKERLEPQETMVLVEQVEKVKRRI